MTPNPPTSAVAVLVQTLTLAFCFLAIALGGFFAYGAAFPGPCGDNAGPGLGVIESWVLNLPLGLVSVAIGFFVKKGSQKLRKICLWTAFVTLLVPLAGTYFLSLRHCP